MEITNYTKSLGTSVIRPMEKQLEESMIIENHYSHKWNTSFGIINFGIFRKKRSYPKYSKGKEYITAYRHNLRTIYRALCLAYVLELTDDFEVLKNRILNNQTNKEIQDYMKLALSNRYIIEKAERNGLQHKIEELRLLFE